MIMVLMTMMTVPEMSREESLRCARVVWSTTKTVVFMSMMIIMVLDMMMMVMVLMTTMLVNYLGKARMMLSRKWEWLPKKPRGSPH